MSQIIWRRTSLISVLNPIWKRQYNNWSKGNADALGPDAQAVKDFLCEHVLGGAKDGQVAKAYKAEIEGSF